MSGRLDQSLDSIIDSQKQAKRDVRRRKVPQKTRTAAPVGGVKKATKVHKPALKTAAVATAQGRPTKVIVSNLVCHHLSLIFKSSLLTATPA
jgi:hypothetical protein